VSSEFFKKVSIVNISLFAEGMAVVFKIGICAKRLFAVLQGFNYLRIQ